MPKSWEPAWPMETYNYIILDTGTVIFIIIVGCTSDIRIIRLVTMDLKSPLLAERAASVFPK